MEKQTSLQFFGDRLQLIAREVYSLFVDGSYASRFLLIPLIPSIAAPTFFYRYLIHARIWEIILFDFGISLAVSTIVTTILGCILSIASSGIMSVLAFVARYPI